MESREVAGCIDVLDSDVSRGCDAGKVHDEVSPMSLSRRLRAQKLAAIYMRSLATASATIVERFSVDVLFILRHDILSSARLCYRT